MGLPISASPRGGIGRCYSIHVFLCCQHFYSTIWRRFQCIPRHRTSYANKLKQHLTNAPNDPALVVPGPQAEIRADRGLVAPIFHRRGRTNKKQKLPITDFIYAIGCCSAVFTGTTRADDGTRACLPAPSLSRSSRSVADLASSWSATLSRSDSPANILGLASSTPLTCWTTKLDFRWHLCSRSRMRWPHWLRRVSIQSCSIPNPYGLAGSKSSLLMVTVRT